MLRPNKIYQEAYRAEIAEKLIKITNSINAGNVNASLTSDK